MRGAYITAKLSPTDALRSIVCTSKRSIVLALYKQLVQSPTRYFTLPQSVNMRFSDVFAIGGVLAFANALAVTGEQRSRGRWPSMSDLFPQVAPSPMPIQLTQSLSASPLELSPMLIRPMPNLSVSLGLSLMPTRPTLSLSA